CDDGRPAGSELAELPSFGVYLPRPRSPVLKPSRNLPANRDQPSVYLRAYSSISFCSTAESWTISPVASNAGPSALPAAMCAFLRPALIRFTRHVVGGVPSQCALRS